MVENRSTHIEGYTKAHQQRFQYTLAKVVEHVPTGGRILDIGSHYLGQTVLLAQSGYEVVGFDVGEFVRHPHIIEKAEKHGIRLCETENMAKTGFLSEVDTGSVDGVVLGEILEHLAFNPLEMWRSIFRVVKPNGWIFISTPNSLRLTRRLSQIKRILCGEGIGISVTSIFSGVTYGHHWKEYSRSEIDEYFSFLGIPSENLAFDFYCYRPSLPLRKWYVPKEFYRGVTNRIERAIPFLRPQLFVVVKLPSTGVEVPESPDYF